MRPSALPTLLLRQRVKHAVCALRAYAGRWILDEHPHDQIDPTYCGTFCVDHKSDKLNYSTAWVKDHVTVMETAKEAQHAAQEARTRRVEKELWGRSRVRTAA
jgi:hypothetical protein